MRRNHHYVLKQVNPNLENGILHHSIRSLIHRMTAINITRTAVCQACIVNCTPSGILKYHYSIWIKKEFTVRIQHRCLVSAKCTSRESQGKEPITCHTWMYNRLVNEYTSFSNFCTAGELDINTEDLKGDFFFVLFYITFYNT